MNDKELLGYAAKVFGITGSYYKGFLNDDYVDGIIYTHEDGRQLVWNPLTNDGDALRLAAKLNLTVAINANDSAFVMIGREHTWKEKEPIENDKCAAARRAIVRAAAEIGKVMK